MSGEGSSNVSRSDAFWLIAREMQEGIVEAEREACRLAGLEPFGFIVAPGPVRGVWRDATPPPAVGPRAVEGAEEVGPG